MKGPCSLLCVKRPDHDDMTMMMVCGGMEKTRENVKYKTKRGLFPIRKKFSKA